MEKESDVAGKVVIGLACGCLFIMFSLMSHLVWGFMVGDFFQKVTQQVTVATTTVSIIAEKQECDKWGGQFAMHTGDGVIVWYDGETPPQRNLPSITCNKTTSETLFDYNLQD